MLWMQALIAAWVLHVVAARPRHLAVTLALLVFVPLGDNHSVATAMRGLWGDPSLTSIQLMLLCFMGKTPAALRDDWREPAILVLSGCLLYASALGPWDIDLYRLGYQPLVLVLWFSVPGLIAWWRGSSLYLWLLVIDLLVWRACLIESTNFWDTLIDPLLILSMTTIGLRNFYRIARTRHEQSKRSPQHE